MLLVNYSSSLIQNNLAKKPFYEYRLCCKAWNAYLIISLFSFRQKTDRILRKMKMGRSFLNFLLVLNLQKWDNIRSGEIERQLLLFLERRAGISPRNYRLLQLIDGWLEKSWKRDLILRSRLCGKCATLTGLWNYISTFFLLLAFDSTKD